MPDLLEDADGAPYPEVVQKIWAVLGEDSIDPLLAILTDRGVDRRRPVRSDVGRLLDHLKEGVRAAIAPEPSPEAHLMVPPPSVGAAHWTCAEKTCKWTASTLFTTPETRGATWFEHHGTLPMMAFRPEDAKDERPHSRACGMNCRGHGLSCSPDCPTCRGGRSG